jgi:CheY-like chemotaxis protein
MPGSSERPRPNESDFNNPTLVAVIDDEDMTKDMLQFTYRASPLDPRFTFWERGKDAIKGLREAKKNGDPFHLVITDLRLKDISGLEIIEIIRKEGLADDIVVATGERKLISDEIQERFRISEVVEKVRTGPREWKELVERYRPQNKPPQPNI